METLFRILIQDIPLDNLEGSIKKILCDSFLFALLEVRA